MKNIKFVLQKLKEMFPEESLDDGWGYDEYNNFKIEGNTCDFIFFMDNETTNMNLDDLIKNNMNVEKITMHGVAECFKMNVEELFEDIKNSHISFNHNYEETKNFIVKHPYFPKKLYYNSGRIVMDNPNKNLIEISDITKCKMVQRIEFVKEDE